MIDFLRALPLEGVVTDSAGNVLRNSKVFIKQEIPGGSKLIEQIQTDDSGYFSTSPLRDGIYDFYISGIRVARRIHVADTKSVTVFPASLNNYFPSIKFDLTDETNDNDINKYKHFIQIEQEQIDVNVAGNRFPIYERNLNGLQVGSDLQYFVNFHGISNPTARISCTRFDIEYYTPRPSSNQAFRRIRWAGVPAIRYFEDSKLVIPLDYYSIVPTQPKALYSYANSIISSTEKSPGAGINTISITDASGSLTDPLDGIAANVVKGDILELSFHGETRKFFGIIAKIDRAAFKRVFVIKVWRSSRIKNLNNFTAADTNGLFVKDVNVYPGMFKGLESIGTDASLRFSVSENQESQNMCFNELYNCADV
jgi:hypothetical protein